MSPKRIEDFRHKDDLLVITGAGGFIAGNLVRYFRDKGFRRIRAVDKKPLPEWYQVTPGVENLCLDLSHRANCARALKESDAYPAMAERVYGWEPSTPLRKGLARTYPWIEEQYRLRKAGKRTVV